MKYDIKDFQILEAIHKYGTFAKAAEHLHRTPSAITQSINKLEDLLGFPLFDRSEYRPLMTPEGRLLLNRGRQILKQIENLEFDLHLIKKGFESEFNIAYDDLIDIDCILSLLKAFQKIAPRVIIRLHREVLNGCWDALVQNRVTLALGASGEPPIGLSCDQKIIGEVSFVFAVAAHHPLAKYNNTISNEEIMNYTSIVISDTSINLPVRSSGILSGQPILYVPTMEAKIKAQVLGLGIGYLPKNRIAHLIDEDKLIVKNVTQLKSKTHLKAAWRTDTSSQILNWFLEELDRKKKLGKNII